MYVRAIYPYLTPFGNRRASSTSASLLIILIASRNDLLIIIETETGSPSKITIISNAPSTRRLKNTKILTNKANPNLPVQIYTLKLLKDGSFGLKLLLLPACLKVAPNTCAAPSPTTASSGSDLRRPKPTPTAPTLDLIESNDGRPFSREGLPFSRFAEALPKLPLYGLETAAEAFGDGGTTLMTAAVNGSDELG